jgi:Malectin domain
LKKQTLVRSQHLTMYVVATLVFVVSLTSLPVRADYEVITAINVGGEAHVDSFGIYYEKDNSNQGNAFYCDRYLSVSGLVSPKDEYIYKSYRQNLLNYDLKIKDDGDYLMILKFLQCELAYPGERAMSVKLNARHTVIRNMDITAKVGVGAALDVFVPFRICNGQVHLNYEISQVFGNNLRVELINERGTETLSGLVVIKGDFGSIPDSIWPSREDFDVEKVECLAVEKNQHQVGEHQKMNEFRGYSSNNQPIVLNFYNSSVNFGFLMDRGFNISAVEFLKNLNVSETLISNQI